MELLGPSLHKLMPHAHQHLAAFAHGMLDAVESLHRASFVHRDIKPAVSGQGLPAACLKGDAHADNQLHCTWHVHKKEYPPARMPQNFATQLGFSGSSGAPPKISVLDFGFGERGPWHGG